MFRLRLTFLRFVLSLGLFLAIHASSEARGFLPAVNYATGTQPLSVTTGDFNGDGKPDLAVANSGDNSVSILLGKGDGAFQTVKILTVGHTPAFMGVGDFNGDGRPDLVTADVFGETVSVLLNSPKGFLPAVPYPSGGHAPAALAVADFDGDGILDLVVINACADPECKSGMSAAAFLRGNGDGTFQVMGACDAGSSPVSVAAGDFNRDGKLDIAVADAGGGVSILAGNGDGTFQQAVTVDAPSSVTSVVLGDFNADGKLDLAVIDSLTAISIFLGNGDGTFQPGVPYPTGIGPNGLAVGDFNGDGKPDLAVAVSGSHGSGVTVLFGKGDGTFPSARRFGTGLGAVQLTVGDFNHDRASDIVSANVSGDNISVLMNSGGTFVTTTSSQNPAPVGQSVTFTATVAPSLTTPIPTGKVEFADGTTVLATVSLDPGGQASFTTSGLSLGTHTIRTKYSGDPNFNPNTGKAITQIIQ